ncbi:MAG: CPBP family intramembrane metalloprotease [Clostridiales bacterium]|nr:CPBP family intramembrane metalloprotease [Clostridiales bacterium]
MKKILIYSLCCLFILYAVEQVLELPYLIKTLIKLPLFTMYPMYTIRKMSFEIKRKEFKPVILLSVFVFLVIIIAFLVLNSFINFYTIQNDFKNRMQISTAQFMWAGIYTIVINALIEEIFFRGFIFMKLLKENRFLAYLISAGLFAMYHMAIFKTWFSLPIFLLIMFGLFVGGLIFSYFVEKTNSFLASYMIHVSADLAVVLIGIRVLGIA